MMLRNVPGSFRKLPGYLKHILVISFTRFPCGPTVFGILTGGANLQRQLRHEVAWIKTIVPNGPEFAGKIRGPSVMIFINIGYYILYYWDTVCYVFPYKWRIVQRL